MMRPDRRRILPLLSVVLGGAGLLAFFACNTPFIPIPPPDPTFAPIEVADGTGAMRWQASSGPTPAMAGAKVFLFNGTLGAGVIARARPDGSYVAGPLEGTMGDCVQIHYETTTGEESEVIFRRLQAGLATAASSCR